LIVGDIENLRGQHALAAVHDEINIRLCAGAPALFRENVEGIVPDVSWHIIPL
jgi:hypothetical protein